MKLTKSLRFATPFLEDDMKTHILIGALLVGAASAYPATVLPQAYPSKTIRLIVGNATGGSYDAYARIIARHMGKYIPGAPTIIVFNMPGADGIISANHLYNLADKDGTTIGTFNRYIALMKLLGNDQAQFVPEHFGWLGTTASYSDNAYLFVIRAALPITRRLPMP